MLVHLLYSSIWTTKTGDILAEMHHNRAPIKIKENCHAHRIMYRVHIIPTARWRCTNYEKYTFARSVGKFSDNIYVCVLILSHHPIHNGDLNVIIWLTYVQNEFRTRYSKNVMFHSPWLRCTSKITPWFTSWSCRPCRLTPWNTSTSTQ